MLFESFFSNAEIDQAMRQTVDLFYDREHPASPTETRGETGCEIDSASLGNHLKPGHTLSLQNRPTEVIQNKSSYSSLRSVLQTFFVTAVERLYTEHTRAEDMATQGCARSADMGAGWPGGVSRPSSILAQSDKSREREGSVLAVKKPLSLFMIRLAFWCANCVDRT